MSKDKKHVISKEFSQDELRQKVDGFSLESIEDKKENIYKTTDQGVYYPPDDKS
jgi:hypothetical protein